MNVSVSEKNKENETGVIKYSKDCIYTGDYVLVNNKKIKQGRGKLLFNSHFYTKSFEESYEGEWKNDMKQGKGLYRYINGATYEGDWKNDCQEGKGIYLFADGSYYEGDWEAHKMHGKGVYVDIKGKKWIGEFRNGCFHSGKQKELQIESMKEEKIKVFRLKIQTFLQNMSVAIEKDKKAVKEVLKKNLSSENATECATYISEKLTKFEDKKPEIWWGKKDENLRNYFEIQKNSNLFKRYRKSIFSCFEQTLFHYWGICSCHWGRKR